VVGLKSFSGVRRVRSAAYMYVRVSVDRWTASWMCATLMYILGLWLARRLRTRVRVMLSKNLLIYCQTGSTKVEPTFYHYILLLGVGYYYIAEHATDLWAPEPCSRRSGRAAGDRVC